MSDEKADDGILGKAKRLANQVGEYARSDEARDKLDALKKKASQASEAASSEAKALRAKASAGVKKAIEGMQGVPVTAPEGLPTGEPKTGDMPEAAIPSPEKSGCGPVTWVIVIIVVAILMAIGTRQSRNELRATLTEADGLWTIGQQKDAVEKYLEAWKTHGSYEFKFSDAERRDLAPYLPGFYGRTIKFYMDRYEQDPSEHSKDLDSARDIYRSALDNGIIIPRELVDRYNSRSRVRNAAERAKGEKLRTFREVVEKLKDMPDRFAGRTVREGYTRELYGAINGFAEVPFEPNVQTEEGKKIVELYESDVQGRYHGDLSNTLESLVREIEAQILNRP